MIDSRSKIRGNQLLFLLKLPRNKFLRLLINIALIIFWFALGSLFDGQVLQSKLINTIFFFFAGVMVNFDVYLNVGQTFYKFIEAIIKFTPIILFTWYFWNEKIKLRLRKYTTTSNADELKKYADLKSQGIITEEEFQAKKKKLLDS